MYLFFCHFLYVPLKLRVQALAFFCCECIARDVKNASCPPKAIHSETNRYEKYASNNESRHQFTSEI